MKLSAFSPLHQWFWNFVHGLYIKLSCACFFFVFFLHDMSFFCCFFFYLFFSCMKCYGMIEIVSGYFVNSSPLTALHWPCWNVAYVLYMVMKYSYDFCIIFHYFFSLLVLFGHLFAWKAVFNYRLWILYDIISTFSNTDSLEFVDLNAWNNNVHGIFFCIMFHFFQLREHCFCLKCYDIL